ncbi:Hypothetical predicted protein [Podarcis lilfordi]|uniref:Uncharacterized protein n=1 Tax=Podarcis lilfordi TaxID=74358 RepID=A0AA35KPS7_9SAUR|nr:Hypothetical predicted protein [Podarcis lilfordi]
MRGTEHWPNPISQETGSSLMHISSDETGCYQQLLMQQLVKEPKKTTRSFLKEAHNFNKGTHSSRASSLPL